MWINFIILYFFFFLNIFSNFNILVTLLNVYKKIIFSLYFYLSMYMLWLTCIYMFCKLTNFSAISQISVYKSKNSQFRTLLLVTKLCCIGKMFNKEGKFYFLWKSSATSLVIFFKSQLWYSSFCVTISYLMYISF